MLFSNRKAPAVDGIVALGLLSILSLHPTTVFAQNDPPAAQGDQWNGWQNIPEPVGATLNRDWVVNGFKIPVQQSNDTSDPSKVKRAIVGVPGKYRDCWTYFNTIHNTVIQASEKIDLGVDVKVEEVSVAVACYMAQKDLDHGAVDNSTLIFGDTTWASGHYAIGPTEAEHNISAFDVLDNIVANYTDRSVYPNLNTVVLAGHSLGAQMMQRYPMMRRDFDNEARVHYWAANPGSILWLTEDRPHPDLIAGCDGFDSYKYGIADKIIGYALGDANKLGRAGMVARYLARKVHYAFGTADTGNGDTRCQAETQGASHIERGRNFEQSLIGLGNGTFPAPQTIDYVEGAWHAEEMMMQSKEGIDKLLVLNYNGPS